MTMPTAMEFWGWLAEDQQAGQQSGRPRRAWIVEEANGQVRLAYEAGGAGGKQWHARLAGEAFAPGTEVLVVPLDAKNLIVLGAIKTGGA